MSGWEIFFIILGIIIFIGIIRIIINHPATFFEALMEILWLDVVGDVLGAILENIDLD